MLNRTPINAANAGKRSALSPLAAVDIIIA